MERYLLTARKAKIPYEVEELDLRLYTAEELCYYIYNYLPLIDDDFADATFLSFIRKELGLAEMADKIGKYSASSGDSGNTLLMILTEIGYYHPDELEKFEEKLAKRRRQNPIDKTLDKADSLFELGRYQKAIRYYRVLENGKDIRIKDKIRVRVLSSIANCYGRMYVFDKAMEYFRKLYDFTNREEALKKMVHLSLLSGISMPKGYSDFASEAQLEEWKEEYFEKEAVEKVKVEKEEMLEAFLAPKRKLDEELSQYLEEIKQKYRFMVG